MFEGDTIEIKATVKRKAGSTFISDASEVMIKIKEPDETIVTRTLTGGQVSNRGNGVYATLYDLPAEGRYFVAVRATSPANEKIGGTDQFDVASLF